MFAFVDDVRELVLHKGGTGFAHICGVGTFIVGEHQTDNDKQRLRQHFWKMAAQIFRQKIFPGQFFQKGTDAASQSDKAQHRENAQNIAVIRKIASRVDEEGQQHRRRSQHDLAPAGQKTAGQKEGRHAKDGEGGELNVAQKRIAGAQQDRQQKTGDAGSFFTVIQENIVVKIHLEQVAQGMICGKIEQHQNGGNRHAAQEYKTALDAPQQFAVFDTEEKEHGHVGQMKAQKGIFYPENAPRQYPVGKQHGVSHGAALIFPEIGQGVIEGHRQQAHAQLLRAVSLTEALGGEQQGAQNGENAIGGRRAQVEADDF